MSSQEYMTRAPVPMGQWLLDASVPAPSAVKATSAEYKQDDEDDQKCGAIHGSLLRETEQANVARIERAVMISTLLSSHLVPLFAEILFDRLHFPRRLVLHRNE